MSGRSHHGDYEDRARVRQVKRALYEKRRASGICVNCPHEPAAPGRILGLKCLARMAERNARRYVPVAKHPNWPTMRRCWCTALLQPKEEATHVHLAPPRAADYARQHSPLGCAI